MSDDGWGDESAGTFSGVGDAAPARGGGARGGGGAAGACFKCGETGHMSRECTKGEYLASPPPPRVLDPDPYGRAWICIPNIDPYPHVLMKDETETMRVRFKTQYTI